MAATVAPGLERRLKAELDGEVLFDRFSRGRYATDASAYQMMPLGVVVPKTTAEADARHPSVTFTVEGRPAAR